MAQQIVFHKLCGTGNDFIVVDNRTKDVRPTLEKVKKLCDRHYGIGGDGLILIEKSKKQDLCMRIFNADGSEAEMCGNGMRTAAWVAYHILGTPRSLTFETLAGAIKTTVRDDVVKVRLSDPTDFRDYTPIEVADGIFYFYFINTGVPHCVIFEDVVTTFPVESIGREIRHHEHFEPAGTNVNFVQVLSKKRIRVRTYERGVETETLACGTGATASAIISAVIGKCTSPVTVLTQSGEKLTIYFDIEKYTVTNVFLEGAVTYVFEGSIKI